MTRRDGPPSSNSQKCKKRITRPSSLMTVSPYLQGLSEKKGFEREHALASIKKGLTTTLEKHLLEHKFATFLYNCLNSIKKGSTREMELSLHVIGLLSITVGCQDKMAEIYRESLPLLSKALKSEGPNNTTLIKILDCLAIVGFFGASNSEETERAMQIIWEFINSESEKNNVNVKLSTEVLVAGVYAWLFLLTSMEGWRLSHNYWEGAISYFSELLEHKHSFVRRAASEALALIFETDSIDKFWSQAKDSSLVKYSHMRQLLRECVSRKLERETSINKVVNYFASFSCPTTCLSIKGKGMTFSSWYRMIQLRFLRSFLGDGFEKHVEENEKLQNLFDFNPSKSNNLGKQLYASTTDKICVRFFLPEERDQEKLTKEERKKERVWRNSVLDKAKTELRSKHRLLSQEMNSYCFD